jgi:hypothetical protein
MTTARETVTAHSRCRSRSFFLFVEKTRTRLRSSALPWCSFEQVNTGFCHAIRAQRCGRLGLDSVATSEPPTKSHLSKFR